MEHILSFPHAAAPWISLGLLIAFLCARPTIRKGKARSAAMRNKRYPRPYDRRMGSPHWWDWDEGTIKRGIPAIQSGDMAALERAE